jgi:UDPglucose--hexose-1-phosphate uridylyltransferase
MTIETRVDPETGDWRLVAPMRSARPDDSGGATPRTCPFCPGNEHLTPPERMRVSGGSGGWRIRVVPNKYAVVSADGAPVPPLGGGAPRAPFAATAEHFPATGEHEVVIESPDHDWDLREADADQAVAVLLAVRQRCRVLGASRPAVIAFRNYGRAAGASLRHPHSQVVALDRVPPGLQARWRRARRHHETTGGRLMDAIASAERAAGDRVIADGDGLLVYQPHAAAVPHHTTLLPADGAATLGAASDGAVAAVARRLPALLSALAALLDDPAYNLVVHAGPADEAGAGDWYQWHVSVYPRVGTIGGLELGTGLMVNATAPERTAPLLRRAVAQVSSDGQ